MLVQSVPLFAANRIRATGRPTAETFHLSDRLEGPRASHGPASTAALASLNTLLAIQQVEPDRQQMRRRAVRRGGHLLDALQDVQLDLLGSGDAHRSLARVQALLADEAVAEDRELRSVLEEIEVRAVVELAKRERDGEAPWIT